MAAMGGGEWKSDGDQLKHSTSNWSLQYAHREWSSIGDQPKHVTSNWSLKHVHRTALR